MFLSNFTDCMKQTCGNCFKYFGMLLAFVIFVGLIVFLARIMPSGDKVTLRHQSNNTSSTRRPQLLYKPYIGKPPVCRMSWVSWFNVNVTEFVSYDHKTNRFTVQESNILSLRLSLKIDGENVRKDTINVVCIEYSDETQKCKATLFKKGEHGVLYIKDKIFALPGFTFTITVLHTTILKRHSKHNNLKIAKSFTSGPE